MSAPQAVTFDYWNTLVRLGAQPPDARAKRLLGVLTTHGAVVDLDLVRTGLDVARVRFDEGWRMNRQYVLADAVADLVEVVGVDPEPDLTAALRDEWLASGREATVSLTETGVGEVLAQLREAGIGIGVISDSGLIPGAVLRGHLERFGVAELVDHWSFSDEVGVYKPHPDIFAHAFAGLGAAAADVVHVGDLHRTDVAGALAAGASAVRYRGVVDDPDAPGELSHPVVDRLGEIMTLLKVGRGGRR